MRSSIRTPCLSVLFSLLISHFSLLLADEGTWKLVWQDDFERAEIGDGWYLRSGSAGIVDGRLFLTGGGATILVNRSFAPDVKIEFTAEANPDAPPCDLSATVAGSNLTGYGHLLAFGGRNNQINQIVGYGAHDRDEDPPFVIEQGRKYRLEAVKEGPRLALFVDPSVAPPASAVTHPGTPRGSGGHPILETEVSDPLGGPGFDRVGLVTWNGMYVDDVRVYERTTPAPGGPVIITKMPDVGLRWKDRRLTLDAAADVSDDTARGIELYNNRQYREAFDTLAGVGSPERGTGILPVNHGLEGRATRRSVAALAYVLGDLAYVIRPGDQQRLVQLAEQVASQHPDDEAAHQFVLAARWFSRITLRSRDRIACIRLMVPGPENNPFFYNARLFMARFHRASAQEGGDRVRLAEAIDMFQELKQLWPEVQSLRELTGESIPWGEELIHDESAGPAWARYLQEAFARQQAVLHWWFTERQSPDGQLGGGWGDDVEILRDWVSVACIATAGETAVAGIERLAQGVWDLVLEDGYCPGIGDVEHEAEPSADALPTMLLLRYGDPRWVEYNLRSAKTIRETFMAVNDRGFLQFMSTEFGTGGVNRKPGSGGDTGYHARAMKHFIWLAWHGIPEARDVFCQWSDMWRDVTTRRIGTKPPGFAPSSVFYPSGSVDPPTGKPWYDARSHYYGFPGLPGMVHDSFLTAYFLSGDRTYLEPVQMMMDLATIGPLRRTNPDLPPDDIDNLLATVAHQAGRDLTSAYRRLTGERVYDEYTLRQCTATQRYWIDYDLDRYAHSFERLAKGMRHNFALRTLETLQTDRAGLGGANEVLGAYTGAVQSFRDARCPTQAVTYDSPDLNFAALVTETTPERLRVRMYQFNAEPMRIGLKPWRLTPGVYVLNTGEPVAGESPVQQRYTWTGGIGIEHKHRGTPIWIEVPSKKEWVVDLWLKQAIDRPAVLPDLAVHARDLQRKSDSVMTVTVHNIGGAAAGSFDVVLQARRGDAWQEVSRVTVDGLPAVSGFEPVRHEAKLSCPSGAGELRVVLDADDQVDESYELNNAAAPAGR